MFGHHVNLRGNEARNSTDFGMDEGRGDGAEATREPANEFRHRDPLLGGLRLQGLEVFDRQIHV